MWRSKKFLLIGVLVTVLLVGGIAGVAIANADNGDNTQPKTMLTRVAEILGIDQQKLEDAVTQARTEMRDEALQKLVDEGKLTQDQADQYKEWLQSEPDMSQYRQQLRDWQQARPGVPPEVQQWEEARPDMPNYFGFGGRMHGGFRGMGGGFCGPLAPQP